MEYRADFNRYDSEWRVYQEGDDPRPVTNSMFKGKAAKQDVELIVRAVNSHQSLIDALTGLLEFADRTGQGCGYQVEKARVAITKATA